MIEIKVDLLVVGSIECSSHASAHDLNTVGCGANSVAIKATNIPDFVTVGSCRFDLRDAIVIDASDKPMRIASLMIPKGKAIFATGSITTTL